MTRSLQMKLTVGLISLTCGTLVANAANWPMKGRDMQHTGRADYVVPPARMNDTFFNFPAWQKRTPNSPAEGNPGASSMVFYDAAGPMGEDVVVAGYHWPKGVQGMDRHTGKLLWSGNPAGGETIGEMTPAFSMDGTTVYVTNDATEDAMYPNGHPLMAFFTAVGPSIYWHNGADASPTHLEMHSPTISPDGRVFLHSWVDRPHAGLDDGTAIHEIWAAATPTDSGLADASLYVRGGILMVVSVGRSGWITAHNGITGAELFAVDIGHEMDATPTIDPANGRIFVPAFSGGSVYVVGLDKFGNMLWTTPSKPVYDHQPGTNNPQRAQSAGCLSWDGGTYYFQTVNPQGDGGLYAINTADGSVKWYFGTSSRGGEGVYCSPIVTRNGVIIVSSNDNGVYAAIHDQGATPVLLDILPMDGYANARATACLSEDGRLYLPTRMVWYVGNGDNETPNYSVENLFTAFDLTASAQITLAPPTGQRAQALNGAVKVQWRAVIDPAGQFDHYAIYRATAAFTSVAGMTPIDTVNDINATQYSDGMVVNGTHYYYAVTSVSTSNGEDKAVASVGPRTPYDETDLQVVSIARTPRYERYCAAYTDYQVTEPDGFGPYWFSAATGIGCGQDALTQRFPNVGDPVTYTATVRNRGTNYWNGSIWVDWRVDGQIADQPSPHLMLAPGETATVDFIHPWDGLSHEIGFAFDPPDDRPTNNSLAIDTKSVAFLSYADQTYLENFREELTGYPQAATGDLIDWLNRHMTRFNALFAAAGSPKRVHFDTLSVLDDLDPDPSGNTLPFAIFPFRYRAADGSIRLSGYYDAAEDLDYGLLHEMGHQLGLIDIYQLDLGGGENDVSGLPYYGAPPCLMHGVSHVLSPHSALGMTHWQDKAHGYFGQYLYGIPAQVRMRFIGMDGQPLTGAAVRMYQMCDRPGIGKRITNQVKAQGVTDANGEWTLPNVAIDHNLVPTTYAGDSLPDNPFGYVAVVGHNGVLHFKVERDGFADYAWLDITECNVAYYAGQTASATFDRSVHLGGSVQHFPPPDLTENNAASWSGRADGGGTSTCANDATRVHDGTASIRYETTGCFDTAMRYASDRLVQWDLTGLQNIRFWCYAANTNQYGFQDETPWIRFGGPSGFFELRSHSTLLNAAIGQWTEFVIPFAGDAEWYRTDFGTPDLANVNYLEIHSDTWDCAFTLWIDGLRFEPAPAPQPGDVNCDRAVTVADVPDFVLALLDPTAYAAAHANCYLAVADMNADGHVDGDDVGLFVNVILP